MDNKRIEELEAQIAELRRRWPKHTPPPALMRQLDELEEALARERARAADEEGKGA
jgi:ribosomal protein L29